MKNLNITIKKPENRLMKKGNILLVFALIFCVFTSAQNQTTYQATWQSLSSYQIPEWFKDAKFGVFIHWGVYSVPAYGGEWYPRHMYEKDGEYYKHHVNKYGPVDKFGYKDFIPMFKAEKFIAEEWVSLFKKAGFKYVVPVAEHHDGFSMYKSAINKWNAFNMGPKRDVVGEIAEATKKAGLIFGLSSHRIEHWWFFNGGKKFASDVLDNKYEDLYGPGMSGFETVSPEFMNDWLMRNIELIDNYHPQLFWFDWWIEQPCMDPYLRSFASYYYNKGKEWNKGVVINYKYNSYKDNSAVLDIERGKLAGIRKQAWQTDDAVSYKSWGYIENDSFKTAKYLVNNLVDIVSKNGNLLLNIGPKSDGTIPNDVQNLLLEVGNWLAINGEAIYGTRPWTSFGEGPTGVAGGAFSDAKDKPFTADDIRFTTKGDVLYAVSLDNPSAKITIISLASGKFSKIKSIEILGSTAKINWKQSSTGLVIEPIKNYPAKYATTYKILYEK